MNNGGAFQIARSLFESDIRVWKPCRWLKVWIYIIGAVNHTDGKQFKRGQAFLTYDQIYFDCKLKAEGVQKSAIDNVIRRMKKQGKLTTHKTTRGFVVTVVKYNEYQTFDNYKNDKGNETLTKHKRNTNDTIPKECKEGKNVIIVNGETSKEIDDNIKKQIREVIPSEVLQNEPNKYYTLMELVALGLSTPCSEKGIQGRIYDIEKKLEGNGIYTIDVVGQKEYDRKTARKIAQNCREWNNKQGKECGNVLNSYNKFLSNNKNK